MPKASGGELQHVLDPIGYLGMCHLRDSSVMYQAEEHANVYAGLPQADNELDQSFAQLLRMC